MNPSSTILLFFVFCIIINTLPVWFRSGSAPLSRGQGQSPFANVGATGVPARMASPPLASGFGLTSHVPGSGPPSARSVGGMGGGSGPVASSVGRPLSMGPPRSVGGMGGSGPVASSVGRPLSMTRSYSPPLPPANAFGTTAINNQVKRVFNAVTYIIYYSLSSKYRGRGVL